MILGAKSYNLDLNTESYMYNQKREKKHCKIDISELILGTFLLI